MITQISVAKPITNLGIDPSSIKIKTPSGLNINDPKELLTNQKAMLILDMLSKLRDVQETDIRTGQVKYDKTRKLVYIVLGKVEAEFYAMSLGGPNNKPGDIISGIKSDFTEDEVINQN